MTETTKTPNPLKQARRDKREAKAIRRFIEDYREINRGTLTYNELATLRGMLAYANVRVQVAYDALATLKADEATK